MNSSKLKSINKDIFIRNKLSKDHATICAEAIINAELVGAPSHGLSRLKMYCDRISKKVINPKAKIKIKKINNNWNELQLVSSEYMHRLCLGSVDLWVDLSFPRHNGSN